jgi:LDH2 family malate/lactate/ureidoglycolate dehydrogenase
MKLPEYVRDVRQAGLQPAAEPVVQHEVKSTALVDGSATFGQVAARFSADVAIRKAREMGAAAIAVAHCHHTGRIGEWVERIAHEHLIGIAMVSEAQRPFALAPFGGAVGALATNPFACAIPRAHGRPPVLLDYATSAASIGKLQVARDKSEDVPGGWITDVAGRPTCDPGQFFAGGVLLPFGEHKGYALAVIVQLLAVGLSRADALPRTERSSCLYLTAIDPSCFRPIDEFEAFVEETVARLQAVPPASDGGEVLVPGDPEVRFRLARKDGIPIPEATWLRISSLANELGVGLDRPAG